jgi:hypothetical protein
MVESSMGTIATSTSTTIARKDRRVDAFGTTVMGIFSSTTVAGNVQSHAKLPSQNLGYECTWISSPDDFEKATYSSHWTFYYILPVESNVSLPFSECSFFLV